MRITPFASLALITLLCTCGPAQNDVAESHTVPKWQNLALDFAGPATSEQDADNPFLNYRLDVVFTNGDHVLTLPGFYAADGKAAETSADAGPVWRVNFRPDQEGEWTYEPVLRHGDGIVYNADLAAGERIALPSGTITVTAPAAGETGRLVREHPRYLKWAETGEYFLKGGADSPENLLGYQDFDGTYRHSNDFRDGESKTEGLHVFADHANDFTAGPTWQDGKGKNILGAVSYLAGKGINAIYFLTNNIGGDGKDVWPYVDHETFDRFDVSKLDQWERLFTHADDLGMMLHFVLQETENETMLDGGDTGPQRQLYFREFVARFGHHRAVTWNLGEENGPNDWSETHQTTAQQEAMLDWFAANDPYEGYVVLHTHPGEEAFAEIYEPMLGNDALHGLSLQLGNPFEAHEVTKKWLDLSRQANAPWIMTVDETGPWFRGLDPDAGYTVNDGASNNQDSLRAYTLWGNLMAGGAGVEWYFGAKNENNDLNTETWRTREGAWTWTGKTLRFFRENIPFADLTGRDELVSGSAWCLAEPGTGYLVYLPEGGRTTLDLSGEQATSADVLWYDAGVGHKSAVATVEVSDGALLLEAPGPGDWAAWVVAE